MWICVGTTSLGRKGLEDHFNDKFRTLGFDHIRPVYRYCTTSLFQRKKEAKS